MKNRILWLSLAVVTSLAGACDDRDDAVQKNPHFATGGKRASSAAATPGGEDGVGPSGGGDGTPPGGAGQAEGGTATTVAGEASTLGGAGGAGAASGGAGSSSAGASEDPPPYDCVLHPKTHLEIINACTDATRIEKHPVLPPIN